MSDQPSNENADPGQPGRVSTEVVPSDRRQTDLFANNETLNRVLNVEQQRIESFDKRTEVARLAISASDQADERQYQFKMAQLNAETNAGTARLTVIRTLAYVGGVCGILLSALLCYMMFFGTPQQAGLAIRAFGVLGIAFGGYGGITTLTRWVRKLLPP